MSRHRTDSEKAGARPVARMGLGVMEMTEFEDEPVVATSARVMTDFDDEPAIPSAVRAMTDFEDDLEVDNLSAAVSARSPSARVMTDFEEAVPGFEWDPVPPAAAPVSPELAARLAGSLDHSAVPAEADIVPATLAGRWKRRFDRVRKKVLSRELPGWSVSLALHTAIMLGLLCTQLPGMPTNLNLSSVISTVIPEPTEDTVAAPRLEELAFKSEATKQFGSDSDINTGITGGAMATLIGDNPGTGMYAPNSTIIDNVQGTRFKPSVNTDLSAPPSAELLSNVNIKGAASEHAGGLEGAIDRLAFEIGASLRERKTLVIWMFDASLSLHDRRDKIVERFENVYKQLRDLDAESDKSVKTAVAWYGERFGFVTQEPVDDIRTILDKVREIPDDKSGKENVFTALAAVQKKFQPWGKSAGRNVMVIIVTDEKGDDDQYLEQTIHMCRVQGRVKCFVVGNAAPFGRQKGYVRFRYDGMEDDFEVDQGPETILPEALQLGFWGNESDRFNRMSSGYGPYALTRLCAETGGLFLITEEDRGSLRFDPQIMRNYSPDYRPIADYTKGVEKNKAKSALVAAATKTKLEAISLPRLEFRADNDGKLREELTEAQKPAAEMDYKLNAMHSLLQQGVKDRDKLTEARWKAGYDLALGRVLAMRVRIYGYNKLLAEMKIQPKVFQVKGRDQWRLVPSDKITAGPEIKKMAKESEICLKRVVDEHPGTPWAMMAERELSTQFGWEWEEATANYARRDRDRAEREARRVRLADDEKQMKRKREKAVEKERPKL